MSGNSITAFLSAPEQGSAQDLCARWADQTVSLILQFDQPVEALRLADLARRWLLFTLSQTASPEAKHNHPCPWEPPCTFDLFKREQLRFRSDGLPKPYCLAVMTQDHLAEVRVRVFGRAMARFSAVSEALVRAMAASSAWRQELGREAPKIVNRFHDSFHGATPLAACECIDLICHSPVDMSGGKPEVAVGRSLLGRGLRRIDAMARWQGQSLDPSDMTALRQTLDRLSYDERNLTRATYVNNPKHKQIKRFETVTGALRVSGDLTPILPILALLERAQLGRGVVQGLGVVEMRPA